jgi:hypothetical protein
MTDPPYKIEGYKIERSLRRFFAPCHNMGVNVKRFLGPWCLTRESSQE